MILLRQKNFSEESNKNEKAAKVGKEIGMAGGALGVGALGGLGVHKLAKDLDSNVTKRKDRALKKAWNKYHKAVDKQNKVLEKSPEKAAELRQKLDKELAKTSAKARSINSKFGKLKKVSEPISKFAKTKGGKWALIGVPTAALGTGAYLEAKKRDRNK